MYYVQYVHARITGILVKAKEQGLIDDIEFSRGMDLERLEEDEELKLIKNPGRVSGAGGEKRGYPPSPRDLYLFDDPGIGLSRLLQPHKVIVEDAPLCRARLSLVLAVKKVIRNGLCLLGVSAPERM